LLSKPCFAPLFEGIARDWPGFDDFRSNGMLLPANDGAALRTGLPLHRGPHRDYNLMVIERVGHIEADWSSQRWRAPRWAGGDAIAGLARLQRGLHRRLMTRGLKRLALNRRDPLQREADFAELDAMVDALWPASDPWAEDTVIFADQRATTVPFASAPTFRADSLNAIPVRAASLAFA
jgi:hypothetical protein